MITGIGVDIVQIPRIESLFTKYRDRLVSRILHKDEQLQFNLLLESKKAKFLAKRFAAKESISKAFGTGIGYSLQLKNIVIINDNLGKPTVKITATKIQDIEKYNIDVSMSDDYPVAIAFVVIRKI